VTRRGLTGGTPQEDGKAAGEPDWRKWLLMAVTMMTVVLERLAVISTMAVLAVVVAISVMMVMEAAEAAFRSDLYLQAARRHPGP
jgi:hypothetical protein